MLSPAANPRRRRSSAHKLNISTWRRRSASGRLSLSGNLNGVSSAPTAACVEEMGHGIVGNIYFMFLNPSIKVALLSSVLRRRRRRRLYDNKGGFLFAEPAAPSV